MSRIVRAALLQASWTGDKESMIVKHEEYAREAARQGLTQKQIAQLIGRSQPEVSRLLRFHGRSPLALRLRRHSREVRHLIDQAGGSNVRVFGSVATGAEHAPRRLSKRGALYL